MSRRRVSSSQKPIYSFEAMFRPSLRRSALKFEHLCTSRLPDTLLECYATAAGPDSSASPHASFCDSHRQQANQAAEDGMNEQIIRACRTSARPSCPALLASALRPRFFSLDIPFFLPCVAHLSDKRVHTPWKQLTAPSERQKVFSPPFGVVSLVYWAHCVCSSIRSVLGLGAWMEARMDMGS